MTTKVIISVPHTQHDRAVEVVVESESSPGFFKQSQKILKEGDTFEEYVYDNRRIVIREVKV